ncbi:capsular polysaccharide biosynthesis protein [Clostridium polyendosporum]|uniref:Capsular polysaccharide biosynthesis protein n=1 Tax=Clostridium polyendosporum TaxID=69208 RepID=A0A919RYI3_9CLOT|nr:Wzz/FepE/Etk N-terminal domain-containing protein [Clostridium polyendosporum]GIM28701.1 capsular polysaccharide biosynthesis protein [Clostridium polyendosporum]
MELKEYFNIIRKRILLIIIVTLSCTVLSAVISYFVIKPVYKADIAVIIGNNDKVADSTKPNYNDVMMYQKLVQTYSEFVKKRVIAEDVIKELNLDITADELINMISATPKGTTEFLNISVSSTNKDQVAEIANQVAKSLKKVSTEIKNQDNVQLVDGASAPQKPDSPKPLLNIAVAFFVGLMLSIGVAFLLEYLDNTVKDEEELTKLLGIPVIGVIPTIEE